MEKVVEPINCPSVGGTFSNTTAHATKANGFVFVAGQIAVKTGTDPKMVLDAGELGTIEEQTIRILDNIKAILEQAGTSLENVVERRTYLVNPADWDTVGRLLDKYFQPVASTTICVTLLPFSARVEISVVAALPQ